MSAETQIKLKFSSVDFPVVNFNSDQQFTGEQGININIEPKVYFPKDNPNHFKIIQEVHVSADNTFNLFIVAIGNFELSNVEDEKIRHNFVNMNAPAIMFPYIRSFISTFTSNLGNVTGTLNIPPQFFKGELPIISDEDIIPDENSEE
ncbi:MAG: protein-export chaperone SecB [Bergeyella sp.]